MKRPLLVWAEVDLTALSHNLKVINSRLKESGSHVMAIVKADAYGHGMRQISRMLRTQKVGFFGVANINEAKELRKVCTTETILSLGSFHPLQVTDYERHKIIPTVSCEEDLMVLHKKLSKQAKNFPIHIKI